MKNRIVTKLSIIALTILAVIISVGYVIYNNIQKRKKYLYSESEELYEKND